MMFEIDRTKLLQALDVAALGVSGEKGRITSHILFDVGSDGIRMKATNRIIWISVPVDCDRIENTGAFTIEAKRVRTWIKNVIGDTVSVDYDGESVTMRCGEGAREVIARFLTFDESNFPDLGKQREGLDLLLESDAVDFLDSLSFVEPFLADPGGVNSPKNELQVTELWDGRMYGTDSRVLAFLKNDRLASEQEVSAEDLSYLCDVCVQADRTPPAWVFDSGATFGSGDLAATPFEPFGEDFAAKIDELLEDGKDQVTLDGDYAGLAGPAVFETVGDPEVTFEGSSMVPPNALHRLFGGAPGRPGVEAVVELDKDREVVQAYHNRLLAPFRISKNEVSKLVNFLKKTDGVSVRVRRNDTNYFVETDEGSVFGYTESSYQLPPFMDDVPTELVEPHRWEAGCARIQKAIKALSATAASDDDVLNVSLGGQDEEAVLTLSMRTLSEEDESVFPVPCRRTAGEDKQEFKLNKNLLEKVLKHFDDGAVHFGFKRKNNYLKVYQETDGGITKFCLITLIINH